MQIELHFMSYNTQATARSTDWASVLPLGVIDILAVPTNVVKFPKPSPNIKQKFNHTPFGDSKAV